jgi:hypothetical protein
MNTCYRARFFCPAGLFPFASLTDCLYSYVGLTCEKPGGLGFGRLAMVSMNNPG